MQGNHYSAEVPQWAYGALFLVSLGVGIGCSYAGPHGIVLIPAWSIIFFTGEFLSRQRGGGRKHVFDLFRSPQHPDCHRSRV
jgi:hypothetical protein